MSATPKKTTTLPQAIKILKQLEGLPRQEVQTAIESGVFPELVKTGQLTETKKAQEKEIIENSWKLIRRLTNFEGIIITVPKDYCTHRSTRESQLWELRCWKDKHGFLKRGHVDGGVDLFEIMLPEPLQECDCCWRHTLQQVGIDVYDDNWTRDVIKIDDIYMSEIDVITFHKKNQ